MIRKIQEDWYDENRGAGEEKHVGSNNYYTGKPKQVSQTPGEQPEKNQPEPVGSNK